MKKISRIFISFILLAAIVIVVTSFSTKATGYTAKSTPVMHGTEQIATIDLRFYKAAPNVAYYGMKSFLSLMRQEELIVTSTNGGITKVTAPSGATIQVDTASGTITAPDWALFQNPLTPYTYLSGVKDTPCAWTYYSDLVFDDAPKTIVFDFAKYGIPIYTDKEDVYLPLGLLSTMFTDIATNHVLYNGETVYRSVLDMDSIGELPDGYYECEKMRKHLSGQEKRPEDEIKESYGELCFIIDYFYGFPGRAAFEESIRKNGLDETLKTGHEDIRSALMSEDMSDYLCGLARLINEGLDDAGHTVFNGVSPLTSASSSYPELAKKLNKAIKTNEHTAQKTAHNDMTFKIMEARSKAWGNDTYREFGSTAVIRIDDFMPYADEWEEYYAGTGEIPDDPLGITLEGLKRASENPKIKNIMFDLTANTGGSNDLMSAIIDLATGDNTFTGRNVLTGQREHAILHTDKNFDGVIDEKDKKVKYDFNYAVLTTRESFSCGNLFPVLMQKNGAVLLGEPTGGGSCAVQLTTLSNGMMFQMSSYMWALVDENGKSIEAGCKTDIPIARIEPSTPTYPDPYFSSGDYTPFFDDIKLEQMINEWFEENEEVPAA